MIQKYELEKVEKLKGHIDGIAYKVDEINIVSQEIDSKIISEATPKVVDIISQVITEGVSTYLSVLQENTIILEKQLTGMKELVIEVDETLGIEIERVKNE